MSSKKKYKDLKISRELRDIIHGYIMSDGYVRNGALTVDQSAQQEKFVEWLYDKFKAIRTDTPIRTLSRFDQRTGKTTFSKRFSTRALLHGFHSMWYKVFNNEKGEKQFHKGLPKDIKGFFSPTFIAVWFAGDGTKISNPIGAKFEVTAFTPKERERLKKAFKEKYDIETQINRAGTSKKGTEQWTICINSDEYSKFKELITRSDLIPKLFPYKLHKTQ
jgi:hypothetical protein